MMDLSLQASRLLCTSLLVFSVLDGAAHRINTRSNLKISQQEAKISSNKGLIKSHAWTTAPALWGIAEGIISCDFLQSRHEKATDYFREIGKLGSATQSTVSKDETTKPLPIRTWQMDGQTSLSELPRGAVVAVRNPTRKSEAKAILPIDSPYIVKAYAWLSLQDGPCSPQSPFVESGLMAMELLDYSAGWRQADKIIYEAFKIDLEVNTQAKEHKQTILHQFLMKLISALETCAQHNLKPRDSALSNIFLKVDGNGLPISPKLIDLGDEPLEMNEEMPAWLLRQWLHPMVLIALKPPPRYEEDDKGVCDRGDLSQTAEAFCGDQRIEKCLEISATLFMLDCDEVVDELLEENGGLGLYEVLFHVSEQHDEELAKKAKKLVTTKVSDYNNTV